MEKKSYRDELRLLSNFLILSFFIIVIGMYMNVLISYYLESHIKQHVFGASYMTLNNDFYEMLNHELKVNIEKNGDKLISLDPALDQEKQNKQIEYLIDKKVDAIILNPVHWKKVRKGLEAAKAANIPVFVIDTPVYDQELVSSIIVSDNYNIGKLCAQNMKKQKKKANIIILKHDEVKSAMDRIDGFLDEIEGCSQYKVVESIDIQGQAERSMPKVKEILKIYKNIDVIISINDPGAIGALAAIDSIQYENDILVYGVDGSPDGKRMVQDEMMVATVAQFPYKMSHILLEQAYKMLENKKYALENKVTIIDAKLLEKNDINKYGIKRWQ